MANKSLKKQWRKLLLKSLLIYIILSLVYLTGVSIINFKTNNSYKREAIANETRLIDTEKTIILNKINYLIGDVLYINDSLHLTDNNSNDRDKLVTLLSDFSDRRKVYDQIRFIDLDGNEVIRINYSENGSYVTKQEDLQNKKERYYFKDAMSLNQNEVYISNMDLNMENNIVESPNKPMLRLATKYYDKNNVLQGIVVLNYYASEIIDEVKNAGLTSLGKMQLLNSDSYWLYNSADESKEWSFMYNDKLDINFKNEFSKEWNEMQATSNGSWTTENGFFAFSKIFDEEYLTSNVNNCTLVFQGGNTVIVSSISENDTYWYLFNDGILANVIHTTRKNVLALVLILIVSVIIAILITFNDISKARIKYYSEYDVMTGTYNRRSGFEKLESLYKDAEKNGGKISVCFIDINGLKDVNDSLGHEAGDQLITSIVYGIKLCIRSTDFVSRLGGDEFLIILKDMDEGEAEIIWQRINSEYEKINETQNRKYIISASHGIEEFKFNSNEYIDNIVNKADEKMYIEKRIIKKNLKIIR